MLYSRPFFLFFPNSVLPREVSVKIRSLESDYNYVLKSLTQRSFSFSYANYRTGSYMFEVYGP